MDPPPEPGRSYGRTKHHIGDARLPTWPMKGPSTAAKLGREAHAADDGIAGCSLPPRQRDLRARLGKRDGADCACRRGAGRKWEEVLHRVGPADRAVDLWTTTIAAVR